MLRNILLSLCFLSPSAALADWDIRTANDVTVAFLEGMITDEDVNVPTADTYVIMSNGGGMYNAQQIANTLKASEKPVRYLFACSAAAYICDVTRALPINDKAVRAYHWSIVDTAGAKASGVSDQEIEAARQWSDGMILRGIVDCWNPRVASRIISKLADLKDGEWVMMTSDGSIRTVSGTLLDAYVTETLR